MKPIQISTRLGGFLLVATAAALWATDAIFRQPLVGEMPPLLLVFFEHLIALVPLLVWAIYRHGVGSFFDLTRKDWVSAAIIGIGGSAAATVFFTSSFQYVNPSVTILLQKLQPVFSVLLAVVILGEKPKPSFYVLAVVALMASLVLSFPDLDFSFLREDNVRSTRWIGVTYALLAAVLWSASLIAGKSLSNRLAPAQTAAWRFVFGTLTLGVWIIWEGLPFYPPALETGAAWTALIYMGVVSGVVAMALYYEGLKRTTAISATFAELVFPVSAIAINAAFLDQMLNSIELLAGIVLLVSVTLISVEGTHSGSN